MEKGTRFKLPNGAFLQEFFKISLPIILTNLMAASLHIIDNVMVGSLGDLELASVAQANQLTFIMRITFFGIAGGCTIFAAQHWGDNDVPGVRRVIGVSAISALILGAFFALVATVFPEAAMRIYTPDAPVIALGADYLRIVGPSYFVIALSVVFNAANRSTERVRLNMVASFCAIATNAILNYCLIFGHFGFPKMGVRGAALATAIAAVVEAVVLIGWTYFKKYPAAAKLREMKPTSFAYVRKYYKVAVPVMLNEGVWALGTSAYMAVYGRVSIPAVAAMNVVNTVDQVVMAAIWGTMNATAVMVGKRIGANDRQGAMDCSRHMMHMSFVISVIMGVTLYFARGPILSLFNISDASKAIAYAVMGVGAFIIWIRAFNSVNVVGVLRAGGDTIFSLLLDGGAIWLIGVPIAALGALVFKLELQHVYLLIQIEELVKLIIGYIRFRSGKWINQLTNDFQ